VQDCGAPLYGDFNGSDPREVDKLGRERQATGYEDEVQDDHGIKMVLTSQEQSDSSDPIGLGSQRSSAAQSAPAPHTNTNVSHSFLRDIFVAPTVFRESVYKCDLQGPGSDLGIGCVRRHPRG
jgi:hypothetical protein